MVNTQLNDAQVSLVEAGLLLATRWLSQSKRRRNLVLGLRQPMTARHLAVQTELREDVCSRTLSGLKEAGIVFCCNKKAIRSRLYWLTALGRACQKRLLAGFGLQTHAHDFPVVDWDLYGWVCYSHRSAVLKVLSEPLQPAAIKRKARWKIPGLQMSANNVRDVIREFCGKGIVVKVHIRKKAHPRYELSAVGGKLQALLKNVETKVLPRGLLDSPALGKGNQYNAS